MMRIHFSPVLDRRLPVAIVGTVALVVIALSSAHTPVAQAADANTRVPLGTTEAFSVLASTGITNSSTDASPTSAWGFIGSDSVPPEMIAGTEQADEEDTRQALDDLKDAYLNAELSDRADENLITELGDETLTAGVYGSNSGLNLTGSLTLTGDADDVFVFQSGSTLITASDSSVVLAGEVQACNVFWQVGSSATFGTRTSFAGTVMALASISAQQGATFEGRLLARTGAVTLINNTITRPGCADDGGDDDGDDTGGTDAGDDTDGTDAGDDTGGTDGDTDGGDSTGDTDGGGTTGGADSDGVTGGTDGGGADGGGADGSSNVSDGSGTSSSSNGVLPDAGGSSFWLLAGGIVTLVAGSALVWGRRIRGTRAR